MKMLTVDYLEGNSHHRSTNAVGMLRRLFLALKVWRSRVG